MNINFEALVKTTPPQMCARCSGGYHYEIFCDGEKLEKVVYASEYHGVALVSEAIPVKECDGQTKTVAFLYRRTRLKMVEGKIEIREVNRG